MSASSSFMVAEAEDKITDSARVSLLSHMHTFLIDRKITDPMSEMARALAGGQEQASLTVQTKFSLLHEIC